MKIYRARKVKPYRDNTAKRLAAYAIISVIIIFVLTVWGVTLLANLSNLWDGLRGSNVTAPSQDETAPPPPRLIDLATYTNNARITVNGSAEAGSTVTLFRDGVDVDNQLVANDGQFSFKNLTLKEGSNSFTAKSKDGAGNESSDSNQVTVILDTTSPKVTISEPSDGATTSSQFMTVSGKTEPKAHVTINDAQQIVGADGSFSGVVTLQSGSNTITVVVTDEAGNQTRVNRTVTYSP